MNEKITNTKIPKHEIKTIRRCGLTNCLWKHGMLFFDKKHIKLFNVLPKTCIWHSQSYFVIHNFRTTILDIGKNVKRVCWGNNIFNNPLVLPLPDRFATMNGKKKLEKKIKQRNINNKLKYKIYEKEKKQTKLKKNNKIKKKNWLEGTYCCPF